MHYSLNYKGVTESQNFEPVPEGEYLVEIRKKEEKVTKNGAPLIKLRYEIVSGEHKGRIIFDQIVLFKGDEKGAGITKHFLHVIGEPYEDDFVVNTEEWLGKELKVTVTINAQYNNNKVTNRDCADLPF